VELEADEASFRADGGVVGDIDGLLAVDEMLEVAALGDDYILVPVGGLDGRLDFIGLSDSTGDFDVWIPGIGPVGDDNFLAALGEDAAAFFLVEDAAVNVADLEVGLVSRRGPNSRASRPSCGNERRSFRIHQPCRWRRRSCH